MTIRGWAEFPALEFPFGAADAWRAITMHDLPASSHGKPVDVFDDDAALEIELRRVVKGEVRFDRGSRAMYAVDGSNYRQIPIGLVVPKHKEDVVAAVAACRKFDAPILARGGGTRCATPPRNTISHSRRIRARTTAAHSAA
jgi:hypothetical protein